MTLHALYQFPLCFMYDTFIVHNLSLAFHIREHFRLFSELYDGFEKTKSYLGTHTFTPSLFYNKDKLETNRGIKLFQDCDFCNKTKTVIK